MVGWEWVGGIVNVNGLATNFITGDTFDSRWTTLWVERRRGIRYGWAGTGCRWVGRHSMRGIQTMLWVRMRGTMLWVLGRSTLWVGTGNRVWVGRLGWEKYNCTHYNITCTSM